jgi:hypothetical protein
MYIIPDNSFATGADILFVPYISPFLNFMKHVKNHKVFCGAFLQKSDAAGRGNPYRLHRLTLSFISFRFAVS